MFVEDVGRMPVGGVDGQQHHLVGAQPLFEPFASGPGIQGPERPVRKEVFGGDTGVRTQITGLGVNVAGQDAVVGHHGALVAADGEGVAIVAVAWAVGGQAGVEQCPPLGVAGSGRGELIDQCVGVHAAADDDVGAGVDGVAVSVRVGQRTRPQVVQLRCDAGFDEGQDAHARTSISASSGEYCGRVRT
ncbi:hypothetical protein [Nocardia cyriacigeorgica]|uniref:hypothetical protein n=1 Tax=Nocardia cyriacigeorgica TaxID=135487 RepID=UPI002455BAC3|nr:hypothetical protein [Nocardia cyriacigeorgica]